MTRDSVCPFENMADISKISKHKKLIESKDFGNYTIHSKSFSLYEPQNNLINFEKESKKRKTEEAKANQFQDQFGKQKSNTKSIFYLIFTNYLQIIYKLFINNLN